MQILLSIDDTDNLESRGTGEIASLIAEALEGNGWGTAGMVTRHQLLVHPDIPYTSHNSAMCFTARLAGPEVFDEVIGFAGKFLDSECAEGSDPGLCIAALDRIPSPAELIAFGQRAKQEVVSMGDAQELAARLGIHLSMHGGTGQGIIGALAGAGLRLSGNDGRMKGRLKFEGDAEVLRVADLMAHPEIDAVRCVGGETPEPEDLVALWDKPKTVLLEGRSVLLLNAAQKAGEVTWQTLHRKELRGY